MKLCQKHRIHFVSDEIYALSCYENHEAPDAPTFTSALSIPLEGVIEPGLVHVLYGMSKVCRSINLRPVHGSIASWTRSSQCGQDFSANGFRLGALLSQHNDLVLRGLTSVATFSWPSGLSDKAWTAILSDDRFMKMWIETNSQRLGENRQRATAVLRKHGIKYHVKV
jgi:aspartate/methionine/tyrosine aminotransferase